MKHWKRILMLVTGAISLIALLQTAQAFNPQPEPPARSRRTDKIQTVKQLPPSGQVLKLQGGEQAIILQNQLYLIKPAPQGKYVLPNGTAIDVNTKGIIIIEG
ncbi:MAG: hypothetical protein KKB30_00380 [Proteobacteria bacterium]|nr:hypothetical protein [Pseudomonadota bacterium]MBU1716672.1 hypothetical protein [Pseudomonadota bacterium]